MGRPPEDLDVEMEPIMENPLVVVAAPNHPLASKTAISLEELVEYTFVVREKASGTRIAMERFFDEHGIEMTHSMEMTSNEAIKQSVQAGLGLGIVSVHTVGLELEAKRLVVLDVIDFPILRHWYVVYKKGKRLSVVAQTFKQFVLFEGKKFTQ